MRTNLQLVSPHFYSYILLQTLELSVVRNPQTSFQLKLNSSKLRTNKTSIQPLIIIMVQISNTLIIAAAVAVPVLSAPLAMDSNPLE
jgi:hypothetical protein